MDLNDSLCDHPAGEAQLLKREACSHAKAKLAAPMLPSACVLCTSAATDAQKEICLSEAGSAGTGYCRSLCKVFLARDGADHSLKDVRDEHGKTCPLDNRKKQILHLAENTAVYFENFFESQRVQNKNIVFAVFHCFLLLHQKP